MTRSRKRWTEKEDAYLQDSWGTVSVERLSAVMHRPVRGIRNRAQRMGLGPAMDAGDYISYNTLLSGLGYHIAPQTKEKFIRLGIPVRRKTLINSAHYVIKLSDFWKWAEKNRGFIDFSKMEPLTFGEEPEWVQEARKVNADLPKKRLRRWTDAEDRELIWALEHGESFWSLRQRFDRTEGAIRSRLYVIGREDLTQRGDWKPWTKEDEERLKNSLLRGEHYDRIGQMLGRPPTAVKARCRKIWGTSHFGEVQRILRKGA